MYLCSRQKAKSLDALKEQSSLLLVWNQLQAYYEFLAQILIKQSRRAIGRTIILNTINKRHCSHLSHYERSFLANTVSQRVH